MKNKNFIRKRQAIYISPNKKSTRIIKTLMDFFFFIKVKIKMVCFSVPSFPIRRAFVTIPPFRKRASRLPSQQVTTDFHPPLPKDSTHKYHRTNVLIVQVFSKTRKIPHISAKDLSSINYQSTYPPAYAHNHDSAHISQCIQRQIKGIKMSSGNEQPN